MLLFWFGDFKIESLKHSIDKTSYEYVLSYNYKRQNSEPTRVEQLLHLPALIIQQLFKLNIKRSKLQKATIIQCWGKFLNHNSIGIERTKNDRC